jgi:hypothetical protein
MISRRVTQQRVKRFPSPTFYRLRIGRTLLRLASVTMTDTNILQALDKRRRYRLTRDSLSLYVRLTTLAQDASFGSRACSTPRSIDVYQRALVDEPNVARCCRTQP